MRKFGLIGFPLTHSFSQKYFEEKFRREKISDCSYSLFPTTSIEEFIPLVKSQPELVGLNVTIPYKEDIIPFLDDINDEAREIGAVNCIKIENGKLKGYNTDVYGFEKSVSSFLKSSVDVAFVLGTGGSSKAVCYVLKKLKIPFKLVSRTEKGNCIIYSQIEGHLKDSNLFINTTPLGMFPQTEAAPEIPYEKVTEKDFFFDLVYNPAETLFLKKGKQNGAQTKNGEEMLELQAEKSWEIWG